MAASHAGAARGGSLQGLLWLAQRLSALFLVAGLALHLAAIHLAPGAGTTWAAAVNRLSQPGWRLFEGLFLAVVTGHALGGLWLIVEDYVTSAAARRLLVMLLAVLGAELLAMGLYTLAVLPAAG